MSQAVRDGAPPGAPGNAGQQREDNGARRTRRRDRLAALGTAAWYAFTALYGAFVLGWLLAGLAAALTRHLPELHGWAAAAALGRHGPGWKPIGRGLLAGAKVSYKADIEVVLDYLFSGVNLLLAAVLFGLARGNWTVRFLVIGMAGAAGAFNLQAHTAIDAIGRATGAGIGWWHVALLHGVGGVAYVLALVLFPDGTLGWLARRAWPVWALLVTTVAGTIALLSVSAQVPHTISFVVLFGLLTPAAGVTAQLARFRQATSTQARQQSRLLLWALGLSFAAPLVLTVITLATHALHTEGLPAMVPGVYGRPGMSSDFAILAKLGPRAAVIFWIFRAVLTMVPFAIVAGVLRFRLWAVERVFNRAFIHGALVTMIGAAYVFGVVQADALLGLPTDWTAPPQVLAAGLVALAFQPVRAWLTRWADRLVYDMLAEVSALSEASEPGPAALGKVARIVAERLAVGTAAVIVDLPDGTSQSARWPPEGPPPRAERRIPVTYRGENVGALCLPRGAERALARARRNLHIDLADSIGVILHNAGLEHQVREIEAQSAEIRTSRQRIVADWDSERRKLERDLHDGAQPGLTAVRLSLGLAAHMGQVGNIAGARKALDELPGHIATALARLRQALRGLDPHIVSLHHLAEALRDQAAVLGAAPRFQIAADPAAQEPLDPQTGAAVYFCCTEALQNTVKHCPPARRWRYRPAWMRACGG